MKNKIIILSTLLIMGFVFITCKDKNTEPVLPNSPSTLIEIKIGTQIWSANNLDQSTFQNGDEISEAKTAQEWKAAGEEGNPAWCYYKFDSNNGKKYGKLYNWYAVRDPRDIAPLGWHVPKVAEWRTLFSYLTNNGFGFSGSGNEIAKSMASTSGWWNSTKEGTVGNNQASNNKSGFTALPAGSCSENGSFYDIESVCIWWCPSSGSASNAWMFALYYNSGVVIELGGDGGRSSGYSVRCVKN